MYILNEDQRERYARNILVPEVDEDGQKALLSARVLVVGSGALGSMVTMQLGASGVGHICVVDFDTVSVSNLQRQIFFNMEEVGEYKCECISSSLGKLNPDVECDARVMKVTADDAPELFAQFDFIIDATDSALSKYMTDNVCKEIGKPCCIAGVSGFKGQVMTSVPGSLRYNDIFGGSPEGVNPPLKPIVRGVMAPTPAIAASVQASEAIKWILINKAGKTEIQLLTDSFLSFDLAKGEFNVFRL